MQTGNKKLSNIKKYFLNERMATKLVRLINDKKKSTNSQNESGFMSAAAGGKRGLRDVDNEELVSDLQAKLMDLEQQNKRLKENVWNS